MEDKIFIWGFIRMYGITAIISMDKLLGYFFIRVETASSYRLMHLWHNGYI